MKFVCDDKEYARLSDIARIYNVNYKTLWTRVNKQLKENPNNNDITSLIKADNRQISTDELLNILETDIAGEVVKNTEYLTTINDTNKSDNEENNISSNINILSGGIDELLNCIDKYEVKDINLIDFENVNTTNLDNFLKEGVFNVFFYNACIYSNKFYACIKNSKSINFQILSFESAPQLIDKVLIFYLGILTNKELKINIISRDHGYNSCLRVLNLSNVHIISPEKKQDKGDNDKVRSFVRAFCIYIINNNKYVRSGKYYKRKELKEIVREWYERKNEHLTEIKLDDIINKFIKYDILIEVSTKYHTNYSFILTKMKLLAEEKD